MHAQFPPAPLGPWLLHDLGTDATETQQGWDCKALFSCNSRRRKVYSCSLRMYGQCFTSESFVRFFFRQVPHIGTAEVEEAQPGTKHSHKTPRMVSGAVLCISQLPMCASGIAHIPTRRGLCHMGTACPTSGWAPALGRAPSICLAPVC